MDINPITNSRELPFVSVVIVTFNRGKVIIQCLVSLQYQTYPKDRYEIIVVDDCSSDGTPKLVEEYGENIRLIRHETNKGIPTARNTGLAAAKGEIVAYIDDDAVADPGWLENLVSPFGSTDVTVTCGRTFAYKTEYFGERFLAAVGYGNPAPLGFGKSKNPLWRFFVYAAAMFKADKVPAEPTEVQTAYGLNCAFRAASLRAIGGYDEGLLADEDSEISTRLRGLGAHIIFVPTAVIHHRHREKILQLIRQTYRRSRYTVHYYAKEKKVLPIFPFPILYASLTAILVIFNPAFGITFGIAAPIALYFWWPIRSIREGNIEYLAYGHVQMALESAAILGMLREKIAIIKKNA